MDLIDPKGAAGTFEEAHDDAVIKRLERTQPLQGGQYWRSLQALPEDSIDKGEVLLIKSVRWVDDAVHTIILRPHPTKILAGLHEHRFLLREFLDSFEPAPDHAQVRARELAQAQGRIVQLQQELVQAQQDPQVLKTIVAHGLLEQAQKAQKGKSDQADQDVKQPGTDLALNLQQSASMVAALGEASLSDALASPLNEPSVQAMRAAAQQQHQVATIKAAWIQSKTKEISGAIAAMTPFFEEQAAAALAMTEDTRKYVDELLKGIESLDLYIGKDVTVQTLCEGESASAQEPLTIVQRRLCMEEELAVWADVDETFDFEKDELFVQALREHPSLVEQIFPTPRCVLVMRTRRYDREYGDEWTNRAKNEQNRAVFLLIRDGQRVHRVYSPVSSHLKADRLFPTHAELDRPFQGMDGTKIRLQDVHYSDRLAAHERLALHYKRFLILAAGLDHRLKLFGPFYEGPQSLHFVSLDFQQRHMRFLADDEKSRMLANALARPSLQDWFEAMNAYAVSGSRLLCNWHRMMTPVTAPGAVVSAKSYHDSDHFAYRPQQWYDITVASIDKGELCVFVPVSGETASGDTRSFNCRVSVDARAEFHYLCLDAVEPEDLHYYIQHRDTREQHLNYIRPFKVALKHLQAEREQEAHTRAKMLSALADGAIAAPEQRADLINRTVRAWRAANRGAPLPRFGAADEAPAQWLSLLDKMAVLAGAVPANVQAIGSWLSDQGLQPLRLVSTGGQRLVAYACAPIHEQDNRLEPFAWVYRISLLPPSKSAPLTPRERSRRLVRMPHHVVAETTLHEWDGQAVADWSDRTSVFADAQTKTAAFDRLEHFAAALEAFHPDRGDALSLDQQLKEHAERVLRWSHARESIPTKQYVEEPAFAVPIGLVRTAGHQHFKATLNVLCVVARKPHEVLWQMAPTEAARGEFEAAYARPYQDKQAARRRIARSDLTQMQRLDDWRLSLVDAAILTSHWPCVQQGFIHENLGVPRRSDLVGGDQLLLADQLQAWLAKISDRNSYDRRSVALATRLERHEDHSVLDKLLGRKLPEDFEPLVVEHRHYRDCASLGPQAPRLCTVARVRAHKPQSISLSDAERDEFKQILVDQGVLSPEQAQNLAWMGSSRVVYSRREASQIVEELGAEALEAAVPFVALGLPEGEFGDRPTLGAPSAP